MPPHLISPHSIPPCLSSQTPATAGTCSSLHITSQPRPCCCHPCCTPPHQWPLHAARCASAWASASPYIYPPPLLLSSNPTWPCSKVRISVGENITRVTERGKVDFLHKRNPVFDERWVPLWVLAYMCQSLSGAVGGTTVPFLGNLAQAHPSGGCPAAVPACSARLHCLLGYTPPVACSLSRAVAEWVGKSGRESLCLPSCSACPPTPASPTTLPAVFHLQPGAAG